MLGNPDPSNSPGARTRPILWLGPDDNVYMFGGGSIAGTFDDIWAYSRENSEWTWVHGSNSSVSPNYGQKGEFHFSVRST